MTGWLQMRLLTLPLNLSLTLTPSLSADLWLAKHLALEGSLAVGASVTLSDPSSGVGAPVLPDVMLRLGLAF